MTCDLCDNRPGVTCPNCAIRSCAECRAKLGRTDRCPSCDAVLTANASCSVTGGCGTGSQEEP
jgi:hypothetical protein